MQNTTLKKSILLLLLVLGVMYAVTGCDSEARKKKTKQPAEKAKVETTAPAPATTEKPRAEQKPVAQAVPPVPAAPVAPSGAQGNWLLIDKSDYTLTVWKDGKAIAVYPIAVGKNAGQKQAVGDLRTPTGDFTVDEIDDASYWTHDFGDGRGEIKGAYGPWFISLATPGWTGIGIHGTHDPSSIGTRASEGCVRLINDDLVELRSLVKVGTCVRIQE